MKTDWKKRYEDAMFAWQQLKAITKKVPANTWTPEYRELAEAVHTLGREYFCIEIPAESCTAENS